MKKHIWAIVLAILTAGTAILIVFISFAEKDTNETRKEVYGPKLLEQAMYEKVFTMLEETPVPTIHDENGNPFKRVHAAIDRHNKFDFLQFDVSDIKTGVEYLYMVCDFSFEYDHIKTNGKIIKIGNDQEVYKYNTTYAWHDKNTGYYSHLMFEDGMKTEEAKNIILSFGKSEYDVLNQIEYKKESKVVRPMYAINGEGIQSIAFDYTRGEKDGASTKWNALFETYQIVASFSDEYTSKLRTADTVINEQAARKSIVLLDQKNNQAAYTDDEIGSLLISSSYGLIEPNSLDEFVKVIDSIN